jgi:hypothetical protein
MNDKLQKDKSSKSEMERSIQLKRMQAALKSARLAPKEIKRIMEYFAQDDHNPGVYTDPRNATDSTDRTPRKLIVVVDWLTRGLRLRRPTKIVVAVESEDLSERNSTE